MKTENQRLAIERGAPPAIHERYQGDAGRRYHERKRAIPRAAWPWVARVRAGKIAPWVRAEDRVLEFGVGLGWNLAEIRCAERIGYDIGDFLKDPVTEQGIRFASDTTHLISGSIDVFLCHHVLEHMANPLAALQEGWRLLRPGGRLLAFAPYEKERRYRRYRACEPNQHLFSWNVQTLANLAEACGFQVEQAKIHGFSYDRFSAVWAARIGLGEWSYRALRRIVQMIHPCWEVQVVARKT